MTKIKETDLKLLNVIISKLIEKQQCTSDTLAEHEGLSSLFSSEKREKYSYLFEMIEEYIEVTPLRVKEFVGVADWSGNAKRFFEEGGFQSIYDEQQETIERNRIQIEKEKIDHRIAKWHKKTFWFTFSISILGFIMALTSLILYILKYGQ